MEALEITLDNTDKAKHEITKSSETLTRIAGRLDRLFSLRGVLTVTGIVIVSVLLSTGLIVAIGAFVGYIADQVDRDDTWPFVIVIGLITAVLYDLGRRLVKSLRGLLTDPGQR